MVTELPAEDFTGCSCGACTAALASVADVVRASLDAALDRELQLELPAPALEVEPALLVQLRIGGRRVGKQAALDRAVEQLRALGYDVRQL